MLELGLYEQIITKYFSDKLANIDRDKFYVNESVLDKAEAAEYLSRYLSLVIRKALTAIVKENSLEKQIALSNKIILLLKKELADEELEEDLIHTQGKILHAILCRLNNSYPDLDRHLKEIMPITRFSQSELFTGSNKRVSMESELRKEILSADRIHFLVSFIKFSGIRIFERELKAFTDSGKRLRIITTTYMGATDVRAIDFLAMLPNTEIRISYNNKNSRLHAKAYLFLRNTGYHTGYIGSSNISHAALTSGLEWNLKMTTQEVGHIIKKFESTFETYWEDPEFETYNAERDRGRLLSALNQYKDTDGTLPTTYFDLLPYPYQKGILEKIEAERTIHNRFKNLVVAATGTGKTMLSAFDYKAYTRLNPNARLLFIAHKKEILQQARATFRAVLKDNNFGELWVDGIQPATINHVFASVQTFNSQHESWKIDADFFHYIVIDEVHHIAADSYRPILSRFSPKILLGLTATPERMDGADILQDFCNVIAAEIRLPEALNRKLLCPFQYFGITDSVDLTAVSWQNGKYVPSELSRIYTANDNRVREILINLRKYLLDIEDVRALGFCVSQEHAAYMAQKFTLAGLKADYLVSDNAHERDAKRRKLITKEINYLFVRDIFNEGVDIPEIDTVLFLRPTESLTIFLQQLGRGLRLAEGKECLTVLDFVGNARSEYDFEGKFRSLVGKTNSSIKKEVEADFPNVPLGCSIVLEKVAKDYILRNISNALSLSRKQLLAKIRNFRHETNQPLTLANFCVFNHIPLQQIYKKGSWKRLCAEAGIIVPFDNKNEALVVTAICKKWLSTSSSAYFKFILSAARKSFNLDFNGLSQNEQLMATMLLYDFYQEPSKSFATENAALSSLGDNPVLVEEMIEVLSFLLNAVDFVEVDNQLRFPLPLNVHARYTRDQILAAMRLSIFKQKSSNREGVAFISDLNAEALFITLSKSEEDYSPTTLYDDYAINERVFHWQSQNAARPDSGKGLSYVKHQEQGKTILLFVREQNNDEFGNTMGYVFLGPATFIDYQGAKPMNIKWQLATPMPSYIWMDSVKMATG